MDNVISINHAKENTLEFNLSIEGTKPQDVSVKFYINGSGIELGFLCEKESDDKWTVKLPILHMLERTAYPFYISVIADGYYFEALRGTINIIATPELYVSQLKNQTIKPEKHEKDEDKEEQDKKKEITETLMHKLKTTKHREKSIQQLAEENIEQLKHEKQAQRIAKIASINSPIILNEVEDIEDIPLLSKINTSKNKQLESSKHKKAIAILEQAGIRQPIPKKKRFSIKS